MQKHGATLADTAFAEGVLEGFQSGDMEKVKAGFAENVTIIQWLGPKAPRLVTSIYPPIYLQNCECYCTSRIFLKTVKILVALYCVVC